MRALRVMQPEDGVETGIWNDAHVTSVSDQAMDSVMHVFQAVVLSMAPVRVPGVREGCII